MITVKLENELGLNNAQTLHDFNDKIIMVGKELKLLNKLKKNGKTIAGYMHLISHYFYGSFWY